MPLSPEEKAKRHRDRLLAKAREYQTSTYMRKFVATDFQKMIRAEFAASCEGFEFAVVNGELTEVWRAVGEVVCVTCGSAHPWNGRAIHTGHFVASRRNSILLEETNVAPQCASCNKDHHGRPLEYSLWMEHVRGEHEIERLKKLKTQSVSFSRDELVDLRIGYGARLKRATQAMKTSVPF